MYGILFIAGIVLSMLTVINLPFILYYLYFFSNAFFTTGEIKDFDEIKQALNENPEIDQPLLLPFKLTVLLGDLILSFRMVFWGISLLLLIIFIFRLFFGELGVMYEYLNWNGFDIAMMWIGSLAVLFLAYIFVKGIYSKKHLIAEDKDDQRLTSK